LNRWQFFEIVSFGIGNNSSDKGTLGIGSAVAVAVAEGDLLISLSDQRKPLVQHGLFHLSSSDPFGDISGAVGSAVFLLMPATALVADVMVSTCVLSASAVVPV